MQEIRFALIGCGRIGEKHAELISKFGKLVAVVDLLPDRVAYFVNLYGTKGYDRLETFFVKETDIDIAVICTPNGLHAQQTIQCVKHKMNVLVEKPMALYTSEVAAISSAISDTGKQVFPIMQNRFNTALEIIKNLLNDGVLGKVFSFQINCFWNRPAAYYADSWHGSKELDGGVLYTQLSHFIDLLSWYFGECIKVKGFVTKQSDKAMEFEDTGSFVLVYPNNVVGSVNYTVNAVPENVEGSFLINTEKGTIKIGGTYLNRVEINTTPFDIVVSPSSANTYEYYKGSGSYHDAVYKNLIDFYVFKKPYYTSFADAAITIATIEKMYLSVSI